MTEESWYYIFLILLIAAYPMGQIAAEIIKLWRGENVEDVAPIKPKHAGH